MWQWNESERIEVAQSMTDKTKTYKGKKHVAALPSGRVVGWGCLCRCFFCLVICSNICGPHVGAYHILKKFQRILERWFLGQELVCFNFREDFFPFSECLVLLILERQRLGCGGCEHHFRYLKS